MATAVLDVHATDQLRARMRGSVVRPGDAGYDDARACFNAMVDRHPAVIAQCSCPEDVMAALAFAGERDLEVSVRAGGHSVGGMSMCDGLVIDVRPMKDIAVDPGGRRVRIGAGCTWSDVDRATQEHGLATTGGRVSTTGVVGLTIGGGSGWLERKHGLSCDNLLAIEMVAADGRLITASATENPELLWAMRGGGGNFGVVTAVEMRLHEVGPIVFAGLLAHPAERGPELLERYLEFHASAPEESSIAFAYLTGPPEEFVPAHLQGAKLAALAGMYAGPPEEGEELMRGLREFEEPAFDIFSAMPYTDFQCAIDDPPGLRNWWTAEYLADVPREAADAFVHFAEAMPLGPSQALLVPWGGAVARPAEETPLAKRDAAWVVHPFGLWESAEQDDEVIGWGRDFRDAMRAYATGGVYLNFIGDEGQDRVRAAFGHGGYERLARVKAQYDPGNVFHGNQNIRPAAREDAV